MAESVETNPRSPNDQSPGEFYTQKNLFRSKKVLNFGDGKSRVVVWRDYFFLKNYAVEHRDNQSGNWIPQYGKSRFVFKSEALIKEDDGRFTVKTKTPLSRRDQVFDGNGILVGQTGRGIGREQEIVRGGRDYVVTSTNRLTGETRSEIVSHKDQEAFEKIASGRASIGFGRKTRSQPGKARSSRSATNAEAHSQDDLEAAYGAIHNGSDDRLVVWRDAQTNSEIVKRGITPEDKVLAPPAETVPATGEYSPAALAAAYREIHNEGDELVPLHAPEQIRQSSSLAPSRQTRQGGSGSDLSWASGTGRPRIPSPVPVPRPYGQLNKPLPALPAEALGPGGAPSYNSWAIPANMNLDPPRAPSPDDTRAPLGPRPSTSPSVRPEFPQSHIASAMALPRQSINGGFHRLTSRFTKGPDGALLTGPLPGPDAIGLTILGDTHRSSIEQSHDSLGLDGGASAFASLQAGGGPALTPHSPHMEMDGGAGALSLFEQHARADRESGSSSNASPVPSHRVRGHQGESNGR